MVRFEPLRGEPLKFRCTKFERPLEPERAAEKFRAPDCAVEPRDDEKPLRAGELPANDRARLVPEPENDRAPLVPPLRENEGPLLRMLEPERPENEPPLRMLGLERPENDRELPMLRPENEEPPR